MIASRMRVYRFYQFRSWLLLVLGWGLLAGCTSQLDPAVNHLPDPADWRLSRRVTATYLLDIGAAMPLAKIDYQGQSYATAKRLEELYQYDNQQRLIYSQTRNLDKPEYSYDWSRASFAYGGGQVEVTNYNVSPLYVKGYALNARGYVSESNTYDQDNYLIKRDLGGGSVITNTIVGGNLVKQVQLDKLGRRTTVYEYDLTRPGIPDPFVILQGRASRNLVSRASMMHESFTGVAPVMPDHFVSTYTYTFDGQGRVSQQTVYVEGFLTANSSSVSQRYLVVNDLTYKD